MIERSPPLLVVDERSKGYPVHLFLRRRDGLGFPIDVTLCLRDVAGPNSSSLDQLVVTLTLVHEDVVLRRVVDLEVLIAKDRKVLLHQLRRNPPAVTGMDDDVRAFFLGNRHAAPRAPRSVTHAKLLLSFLLRPFQM